jgi:hypothetical protein
MNWLCPIWKNTLLLTFEGACNMDEIIIVADQKSGAVKGSDGSKINVNGTKYAVASGSNYRLDGGDTLVVLFPPATWVAPICTVKMPSMR